MLDFSLMILGIAAITLGMIYLIIMGKAYIKKLENDFKNRQND